MEIFRVLHKSGQYGWNYWNKDTVFGILFFDNGIIMINQQHLIEHIAITDETWNGFINRCRSERKS